MARRVAKIDENGGGLMQYLTSYLQSAITFDVPRNYSSEVTFTNRSCLTVPTEV